jgi:hypothetical protein
MGKPANVHRVLDRLLKQAYSRHAEFQVAEAYASIGDVEHMLPWLEKAFAVRDGSLLMLNTNPHFVSVRSDARFQALRARVGVPATQ